MHPILLLTALSNAFAFLASAKPTGSCTSTLREKTSCNNGGITATRYGSAVITSTAAVDCHGCYHLSISRFGGKCATEVFVPTSTEWTTVCGHPTTATGTATATATATATLTINPGGPMIPARE
ncbi:hypothetical protein MMC21_000054 [Puttea exsequens]|nr:hypothetical protein [Puttea exsequens]